MTLLCPFSLYLTHSEAGVQWEFKSMTDNDLPPGDVLIDVCHSRLNYKDALAVIKGPPVVRQFPMIPGVDLAGTVRASSHPSIAVGTPVMVNGHGIGELRWGGFSQRQRVLAEMITPIPALLTAFDAMTIGTAGYTAALCIMALERGGLTPGLGDVLVTGASGGVGSIGVTLLSKRGYRVIASTGKTAEVAYLQSLGASSVIDRAELSPPGKPLQKERWVAAIDTVGGHTLANVCASIKSRGWVAACGLAQSMDFPATVAPFILRGVTLFGIDCVRTPQIEREEAWKRLATELDLAKLHTIINEVPFREIPTRARDLLDGKVRDRLVVNTLA
jgi:acrylyl-CoA reductase (NADPH)